MKKTQPQPIESPTLQEDIREGYYMNFMQIRANLIDANVQIMEVARAYLVLALSKSRTLCRENSGFSCTKHTPHC